MITKPESLLQDTFFWVELYTTLATSVKQQVYCTKLQSWSGQEYDLTQDIVQETIVRIFLQMQKAEKGEGGPVLSPASFGRRVSKNCLIDMARKDARLVRPSCDIELQESMMVENWIDSCEDVLVDMQIESLFTLIAQVIADCPDKQRMALLIDLANRTPVDEPYRPLPVALRRVNINLDIYRNLEPEGEVEKKRHASLLSQAYKRVRIAVLAHIQTRQWDYSA